MKIVIVTPSLSGGGAEKVAVNLSNWWATKGHEVHLIVLLESLDYIGQVANAVEVHRLKQSRLRYSVFALRRSIRKIEGDVVLCVHRSVNVLTALAAPKKCGSVMLFREAGLLSAFKESSLIYFYAYKFAMRHWYRRAAQIVANSPGTRDDLVKNRICSPNMIKVIANPVVPNNLDVLVEEPVEHRWFKDSAVKVILGIGRLHHQKGFDCLIDAMAIAVKKRPELRLLVLGKGPEKVALEKRIANHGIGHYVDMPGFVDNVYPFLKFADLFVLSSRYEGFGNVLAESLAVGTPIVATRCGGGPEFVTEEGKWGRLVEKDNARELCEAILATLDWDVDRGALVTRGTEFAVDRIASQYLSLAEP